MELSAASRFGITVRSMLSDAALSKMVSVMLDDEVTSSAWTKRGAKSARMANEREKSIAGTGRKEKEKRKFRVSWEGGTKSSEGKEES
jgi:hypothetical protein